MAGNLSDEVDMKSKDLRNSENKSAPEKMDAYRAKYAWLDQGKYVAHAAPSLSLSAIRNQRGLPDTGAGA